MTIGARERFLGAQAAPEFESASIKPSRRASVSGSTYQFLPGGGVRVQNGTLKGLIESAYDIRDFQIIGASGWMNSDPFDLVAKSASMNAPTPSDRDNITLTRLRLQALLTDRFRLKVHRERRDVPEYALRVARKGLKVRADTIVDARNGGIEASCGRMIATRASITQFSARLSRELGRPVVDETGLDRKYTFQLEFTPDVGPCSTGSVAAPDAGSRGAPSIFTAIDEQLGLKLESIKGPVDVVVVDHAEMPSPD
jgi:bla regulator protein blaR1